MARAAKAAPAAASAPVPDLPLVGHEGVKAALRRQTAHAILLVGVPHTGRLGLARWWARWLNCSGRGDEPCGTCPSCREFAAGINADLLVVRPRALTRAGRASRRPLIPVGAVSARRRRDEDADAFDGPAVEVAVETAPRHEVRVVAFDEAERFTEEAANALLKLVEEPPNGARYVFVAADRGNVLPTIASRCVTLAVPTVPDARLRAFLAELEPKAPDADALIAFAAGRPGLIVNRTASRRVLALANRFLDGLRAGLDPAFEACEALCRELESPGGLDLELFPQALLLGLRGEAPETRARASAAVTAALEALEKYSPANLVFSVLALRLRAALGLA
ncbi:MAG TPA: DNA polymerase III [Deinococcales bacterium]|nr:DNA polymerase III [Deinococcales bacterium]